MVASPNDTLPSEPFPSLPTALISSAEAALASELNGMWRRMFHGGGLMSRSAQSLACRRPYLSQSFRLCSKVPSNILPPVPFFPTSSTNTSCTLLRSIHLHCAVPPIVPHRSRPGQLSNNHYLSTTSPSVSSSYTLTFLCKSTQLQKNPTAAGGQQLSYSRSHGTMAGPPPNVVETVELNAQEEKIFNTLKQTLAHFGLKTQLRVAGGWVRDKVGSPPLESCHLANSGRHACHKNFHVDSAPPPSWGLSFPGNEKPLLDWSIFMWEYLLFAPECTGWV